MQKIAVFTEGQTELIFVRELLLRVIDNSKLSFQCLVLRAGNSLNVPYEYRCPDPEVHFEIVNVQGDEMVLSAIADAQEGLAKRGYERIIGLRDMYSSAYEKRSPGAIDDNVSREFIHRSKSAINSMTHGSMVRVYFAIMEIEAWFLAMYNLFQELNPVLSVDHIKHELGFDLRTIDPQKAFFKPSDQLQRIFALVGCRYAKKKGDIESIARRMSLEHFDCAKENGRCRCFDDFYQEIMTYS